MIRKKLTLDYQLNTGWLQPYVEGLINGQAVAWCCASCQYTSFPPVRTCKCGRTDGEFKVLNGEASTVYRTYGQDGNFALAKFEGADTASVVKLALPDEVQDWSLFESNELLSGCLKPLQKTSPELVLHIHPIEN